MKLLFTASSNSRFPTKIIPPPNEPVLISNIFHHTIKDNHFSSSVITLPQVKNVQKNQRQPHQNTYYEPVTDLNEIKYKNQPLIHPLKTGMIGRITSNITNCKSCGR